MVEYLCEGSLLVFVDGKERGAVSVEEALARVKARPQQNRIVKDPATGQFSLESYGNQKVEVLGGECV